MSHDVNEPQDRASSSEPVPAHNLETLPKYRRWLVLVSLFALSGVLALLVSRSWWQTEPKRPTVQSASLPERPTLGSDQDVLGPSDDHKAGPLVEPDSEPTPPGLDLEQQAFLEAAKNQTQAGSPAAPDVAVLTDSEHGTNFTDHRLLQLLGDSVWRFKTGRRSSLRAEFGTAVVERLVQGALVIELYPLYAPGLSAPFYTPFTLPGRGTYLAFRARGGNYRLLLEDIEIHSPNKISYRIDGRRGRLDARRLDGSPTADFEAPPPEDSRHADEPDPVKITFADPQPLAELWQRAERLRTEDRLHTLKTHLDRLLSAHPNDTRAKRWRSDVDTWIQQQETTLARDVRKALEDLTEAASDRNLEALDRLWGGTADAETRRYFEQFFARNRRVSAAARVLHIEVRDGVASFEAALTMEARSGRRRDTEIEQRRWRGQLRDGSFLTPFS